MRLDTRNLLKTNPEGNKPFQQIKSSQRFERLLDSIALIEKLQGLVFEAEALLSGTEYHPVENLTDAIRILECAAAELFAPETVDEVRAIPEGEVQRLALARLLSSNDNSSELDQDNPEFVCTDRFYSQIENPELIEAVLRDQTVNTPQELLEWFSAHYEGDDHK